ncbi:hypothetical protein [Metabacillus fastidiosus]|uniref:hypothetical protein n=1 Tax=Metabacillus fastidiosus TaxID=1458 RepID=UPI003D2814E2
MINKTLETVIKQYSDTVNEGNDIVIGLLDGVIFLEKGELTNSPMLIKIEPIDKKIDMTIKEFFAVNE